MLYLPKDKKIRLGDDGTRTEVEGLFSLSDDLKRQVSKALQTLNPASWESVDDAGLILAGPSGSGKGTILSGIKSYLTRSPVIEAIDFTDYRHRFKTATFSDFLASLLNEPSEKKRLAIVDEVLSLSPQEREKALAPDTLEMALKSGIRFLFADAKFAPSAELVAKDLGIRSDFRRRLAEVQLPGLSERPQDIPYIVAARIFQKANELEITRSISTVRIAAEVLLAITDKALESQQFAAVYNGADGVFHNSKQQRISHDTLMVDPNHLPKDYKAFVSPDEADPRIFEFSI
jgi:hypothetical protein